MKRHKNQNLGCRLQHGNFTENEKEREFQKKPNCIAIPTLCKNRNKLMVQPIVSFLSSSRIVLLQFGHLPDKFCI